MNPRERNDPVLKTVWVNAHGGSNPSHSANARRVGNPAHRAFSLIKAEGFEQAGSRKTQKLHNFFKTKQSDGLFTASAVV